LRWLWFQWKQRDRAWNSLDLPCDSQDRELFATSTMVKIGNGKVAMFWTSSWADGRTPKNIAPSLFRKAKRKNITVYKALQGNKWIAHVTPMDTVKELQEYVTLWEAV